jgi:hypothetical protein
MAMRRALARNGAIGVGVYACARVIAAVLHVGLQAATAGLFPAGRLEHAIGAPLAASLPDAIAAAIAGIVIVWLIDSPRPVRWAILPALLWLLAELNDIVVAAPGLVALVPQVIAAALPSCVCLAAARMADWHRRQGATHVE